MSMSMSELKLLFPTEKLDALRFFLGKKQQTIEQEFKEYLDKTYEKMVPAQVREYVESHIDQEPVQQQIPEAEQTPAARERSTRQTRRQREQASAEPAPAPEAQTEAEGPAEEEIQGMTMSM